MVAQGQPVHIVDVRGAEDYAEGHIPGAVNLPKDQWTDAKIVKTRLRRNRINVVYCYSHVCHLAATAAIGFASKGYPVLELEGVWRWWKDNDFAVESSIEYKLAAIDVGDAVKRSSAGECKPARTDLR